MLSYRHSYHAGNHGDVLKHSVLALLLEALARKDTPYCYVETHAGTGRYDLRSGEAEKTGEYRAGIARLWSLSDTAAEAAPYLAAVRALNPDGNLRFYPGSPRIARHLMRPHDRMVLCELHSTDFPLLKQEFTGERNVSVHHQDGYHGLKAYLPPKEKRGLVLIDPSFEVKSEFEQAVQALLQAHKRWPTGIYALWYPILKRATIEQLHTQLRESGIRKILIAELSLRPDEASLGMNGSGMLLINPPWQVDEQLQRLLPWLSQQIDAEQQGYWRVEWLVPE